MTTQNNIARRIPIIYYQVSITRFKSWVRIWVWFSSLLQLLDFKFGFHADHQVKLSLWPYHPGYLLLSHAQNSPALKSWLKILTQNCDSKSVIKIVLAWIQMYMQCSSLLQSVSGNIFCQHVRMINFNDSNRCSRYAHTGTAKYKYMDCWQGFASKAQNSSVWF